MEETKKAWQGQTEKGKDRADEKRDCERTQQRDCVGERAVGYCRSKSLQPTPHRSFAEREKEIAEVIAKYGDLASETSGVMTKKDYSLIMAKNLIKPLIPRMGRLAQHTAFSLLMTSDFYWDKIVLPANEKTEYIPSIFDLFKLLSISQQTFIKYANNGDEDTREACAKIKDEFIDYYQRKGLAKTMQRDYGDVRSQNHFRSTRKRPTANRCG